MSERIKQIYVSTKTKRRLYWISVAKNGDAPLNQKITQDQIADEMLNEKIEADYPNIKVLEKRLNVLEDQLIFELLKPEKEK